MSTKRIRAALARLNVLAVGANDGLSADDAALIAEALDDVREIESAASTAFDRRWRSPKESLSAIGDWLDMAESITKDAP